MLRHAEWLCDLFNVILNFILNYNNSISSYFQIVAPIDIYNRTAYAYPSNLNLFKGMVAGKFGNVEIVYAPNFQMGDTNKTPEFLKKNPLGKVGKKVNKLQLIPPNDETYWIRKR